MLWGRQQRLISQWIQYTVAHRQRLNVNKFDRILNNDPYYTLHMVHKQWIEGKMNKLLNYFYRICGKQCESVAIKTVIWILKYLLKAFVLKFTYAQNRWMQLCGNVMTKREHRRPEIVFLAVFSFVPSTCHTLNHTLITILLFELSLIHSIIFFDSIIRILNAEETDSNFETYLFLQFC